MRVRETERDGPRTARRSKPGCGCRVTLDEVAGVVGMGVDSLREVLPALAAVEPDWAGRPSLPRDTAGEFVRGREAAIFAAAEDWELFAAYRLERAARREEAVIRARDAAVKRHQRANPMYSVTMAGVGVGPPLAIVTPAAHAAGQAAAVEAAAEFDRANRELGFEAWKARRG